MRLVRGLDSGSQALERHRFAMCHATGRGPRSWPPAPGPRQPDWAVDSLRRAAAKIVGPTREPDHLRIARPRGPEGWRAVATEKDDERYLNLIGYSDEEDAVYWSQEDGEKGLPRLRKVTLSDGVVSEVATEPGPAVGVVFDPFTHQVVAVGSADRPADLSLPRQASWARPTPPCRGCSRAATSSSSNWSERPRPGDRPGRGPGSARPAGISSISPARRSRPRRDYPELRDAALGAEYLPPLHAPATA